MIIRFFFMCQLPHTSSILYFDNMSSSVSAQILTTIPFTIDGNTTSIKCIITEHGDIVASGVDYVSALIGCDPEQASKKISSMYSSHPMLRPPKEELRHYSKAALEFMSYLHKHKVFMTLAGIKVFTTATRAGKLSKNAYAGQDIQFIRMTINLRRTAAINMMTTSMQGEVDDISDDGSSIHSHESDCRFYKLQQENQRLREENDELKKRLLD